MPLRSIDFEALFKRSPNPYMLLDRELRFVACNDAYLRETRSRREEVIGRGLFEAFPHDPDDPANTSARQLRNSLEKVLATGEPDVLALIRYRVPRDAGDGELEERVWSAMHTPILGEDGAVVYILQHTVDVTALRERDRADQLEAGVLARAGLAQDAYAQADAELQRLRALFQEAPGFVAVLRGPDHVFEVVNRAFVEVVGERALIGRPVRDALPEIPAQGFVDLLDRVVATGEPYVGRGSRVLLRRRAGALDEAFVDFVFQPIRGAGGAITGVFVQGHEVTEHHRLVEERQALLELLPAHVWAAGADGQLELVNDQVIAYTGASRDALIGGGWRTVVHPDDLPELEARWAAALAAGAAHEAQFRIRRADGAYRWFLVRAQPVRDLDGAVTRWLGVNVDVDEQRQARDELERRAAYEQQLIGIVSHDLRNPLGAIGMSASLLLGRGRGDGLERRALVRIVSASERANRLIGDFLDFAQSRSLGIPVAIAPADLRDVVQQQVEEVRLAHPERDLRVDTAVGDVTVACDADRVAQVLGNLLSNAIHHGAADAPITVSLRGDADGVELAVHNDGAPIPAAVRARIFEPFQRGIRGSGGRGVGLGLFISREIAAAHGGALAVRSAPGEGTTFTLRLPRRG